MITAADTNVLVDIFLADPRYGPLSMEWLQESREHGTIVICNVVYAELVHGFDGRISLDTTLDKLEITVLPIDNDSAYEAGLRWSQYRQAGGPRNRILPDFLIGAHALLKADFFLTRDNGFYQTYFPELKRPSVTE